MFTKYIIFLKNFIFFQFIIYFFCGSLIVFLIHDLKQEYKESIINKQNAQEALTEETLKLYSIVNSKDEILNSYKKYADLNIRAKVNCLNYQELIPKIKAIGVKYKLIEPIDVAINSIFFKNNYIPEFEEDERISINNYSINIKYATSDFITFLKIFQEIYSYMPANTLVTFIRVRNEEILTPLNIYKLSTNQSPNFIYAKLTMYIRELVSN